MRTVADLAPGESATIAYISDDAVGLKLMEMGCLPGAQVRLARVAPLGCPLCLQVGLSLLTIRRQAAAQVLVH